MKVRIKCEVCGNRRLLGEGISLTKFGSGFNINLFPNHVMCGKCRTLLLNKAFKAASDIYRDMVYESTGQLMYKRRV